MIQSSCNQSSNSYTCGNFAPLTSAQLQIFNTAIGTITGVTLTPLLVLTQTGCQTLYYFIAQSTTVTTTPVTTVVLVTVSVDCNGVITLISRNPIEICVREIANICPCNCCNC